MQEDRHIIIKTGRQEKLGDEAPELRHYLIVFGSVAVLIALSWISWFKFGWFH